MPVVGGSTPSVAIQVPVPTPVTKKPRAPKPAAPATQPTQPDDEQQAQPQFTPPPHRKPRWHAVILPWTPGAQKMARAGKPRKYMGETTHADFLRKILSEPHERTHPLVYADWLEENGHSAVAEVLRRHVERIAENDPDASQYAMTSFEPAHWMGYHVGDEGVANRLGQPHAFMPSRGQMTREVPSDLGEGLVGVNVLWPVMPEWYGDNRVFKGQPIHAGIGVPYHEAHRLFSKMRDEGVTNAERAVAAIENARPELKGKKYARLPRRVVQYATLPKRAVKYARPTPEEHAPFHRQILADIDTNRGAPEKTYTHKDGTSSLVYADYLEEHGMPVMAKFVRDAAHATMGHGIYSDPTRIMQYGPKRPGEEVKHPLSVFVYQGLERRGRQRGRSYERIPTLQVSVHSPHPDNPAEVLAFSSDDIPKQHAEQLLKDLAAEGHIAGNDGAARRGLVRPDKMARVGQPVKYAAPIRVSQPGESAHQTLSRILGTRNQVRHGRTALIHRLPNSDDIAVRLHNTNVVVAHRNGQVTLNHGGYMTPTTRRFIAGYGGPHARNVSFQGGRFNILGADGQWREYENNTRHPTVETPRNEHSRLTPEQDALLVAATQGDYSALGALGDSLAESGHTTSGAILSATANQHPQTGFRPRPDWGESHPDAETRHSYTFDDPIHRVSFVRPDGKVWQAVHGGNPLKSH